MAIDPIGNFDPDKIPDPARELSFHADATYVFSRLLTSIIPGVNAAIAAINEALDGDTQTILESLSALSARADNFLRSDAPSVTNHDFHVREDLYVGTAGRAVSRIRFWDETGGNFKSLFYDGGSAGDWRVTTRASVNHILWHSGNDGALAKTAYGAVGSLAFASNNSGGLVEFGAVVAGSSLRPAAASGDSDESVPLSGAWRCLGVKSGGETDWRASIQATLWVRIA